MSPRGRDFFQYLQTLCFLSSCTADLCNWSGSGLVREPFLGSVQQVRLRCSEGSVRWFYPSQALRVVLEPNLSTVRPTAVCIKLFRGFRGAAVYVERSGVLDLVMADDKHPEQVHCFRADWPQSPAVFLLANPQSDVERRVVGFRYELRKKSPAVKGRRAMTQAACGPCDDSEVLQAICTSDFVIRGCIRNVSHDPEQQMSVIEVEEARVYRQRSGVFEREPVLSGGHWHGHVHTLLQCQVRAGPGLFLFTGAEHFGQAWLGCAPRFRDFQALYHSARAAQKIPCDFPLD
ncbi:meteorin-like protein [Brachyhypopomus gauderio]|uniref:meteorin-like protein n=1 Tax=Brachyhypopomus gauderio TaxID=698409 RepID=UPI004041A40D